MRQWSQTCCAASSCRLSCRCRSSSSRTSGARRIAPTPPFGLSPAWFGFLLATPVVWWGGYPFISAAWRALRQGEVNMMTLIALGILVSYFYSVAATFLFEGEVFYEAAAMLTTSASPVTGWRCAAALQRAEPLRLF